MTESESNGLTASKWETRWGGVAVIAIIGFVTSFVGAGVAGIWGSDLGLKIAATCAGVSFLGIVFGFWFAEACKIGRERKKASA